MPQAAHAATPAVQEMVFLAWYPYPLLMWFATTLVILYEEVHNKRISTPSIFSFH